VTPPLALSRALSDGLLDVLMVLEAPHGGEGVREAPPRNEGLPEPPVALGEGVPEPLPHALRLRKGDAEALLERLSDVVALLQPLAVRQVADALREGMPDAEGLPVAPRENSGVPVPLPQPVGEGDAVAGALCVSLRLPVAVLDAVLHALPNGVVVAVPVVEWEAHTLAQALAEAHVEAL
jgi:hypothetical protein